MKVDFYQYTNKGAREINEDYIGCFESNGCYGFFLCDGLGGHGLGDVASEVSVKVMLEEAQKHGYSDNTIEYCFERANQDLLSLHQANGIKDSMRTTGVVLLLKDYFASWGHIGDSRLYYFSQNKFVKRTIDHSVPQMMVLSGEIKERQIRFHPDRNRLLRCIPWINKKYDVDETNISIKQGDSFMLMSDGFWELIDEKKMQKFLKKSKSANEVGEKMVELAFKKGKGTYMDNLSLIIIRIS